MKVSDAISQLQRYYQPDDEIAFAMFDAEDVETRCEERHINLTKKQVSDVLTAMRDDHDNDFGLCWDTMDSAIDSIAPDAPKTYDAPDDDDDD